MNDPVSDQTKLMDCTSSVENRHKRKRVRTMKWQFVSSTRQVVNYKSLYLFDLNKCDAHPNCPRLNHLELLLRNRWFVSVKFETKLSHTAAETYGQNEITDGSNLEG